MKRFLTGFGLGVAGIAVALGLTLGALAVAGPEVGNPPSPPVLQTGGSPTPTPSPTDAKDDRDGKDQGKDEGGKDDDRDGTGPDAMVAPSATPSSDDHIGSGSDDSSDSGSDDDSDDHSDADGDDHEPDDD